MSSVTIRTLSYEEFWSAPNIDGLLTEYASEASIEGLPEPKPHRDIYAALANSGLLHVFGAYRDDTLVGFIVMLVSVNPHYSQPLGVIESFFVASEHRQTGAGLQLLRHAERHAKELGAAGILVSAPFGGRLSQVMSFNPAYRKTNLVFFRELT
jgi:GNAT superfamily N-acetyltransferase